MTIRMISYGYGIKNGKIVVIPCEAEIVKQIFCEYESGKILQEIATDLSERGIEFFDGKCNWNKNTVVRIIQNRKYIGENDYPVIIDRELFEKVNRQKSNKWHKKEKQPEIIEYLKGVVYCGNCGKLLHRRASWGSHEKWYCTYDCQYEIYIDDSFIYNDIRNLLSFANENPHALENFDIKPTYTKTQEIVRYTNEIGRYMNERAPSFNAGKKLIMECASVKFSACRYNANGTIASYISEQLSQEQEYLQKDFLRKIVEKIIVKSNGSMTIRFIGGIEVSEDDIGEKNGSAS